MSKNNKREVNGVLLLDKPEGLTSNAALQKVKRLFGARKAGHTGTLDPLATGMLAICFGEATKFSAYLLEADKQYLATMKLGVRTTTGDADGSVVSSREVKGVDESRLEEACKQFCGTIEQIPPMYSAIKQNGRPLYELAREGKEVTRPSRQVTIFALNVDKRLSETEVALFIHCTKGTYIRTLIEDIGEFLGCGAHVSALRRLSVGPYPAEKMVSMDTLESLLSDPKQPDAADKYLLPIDSMVSHFAKLTLSEAGLFYLKRGQSVDLPYAPSEGWLRLYSKEGAFLGIAEVQKEDGKVSPRRILKQKAS